MNECVIYARMQINSMRPTRLSEDITFSVYFYSFQPTQFRMRQKSNWTSDGMGATNNTKGEGEGRGGDGMGV